jgi:hypothetical protein
MHPFLERDADPVLIPPDQPASANRSKLVERDVKIDRKRPQSIAMDSGAGLRDVVSRTWVQFPPPAEEQQSVLRSFDHGSPVLSTLPRWLWHFEELHRRSRGGEDIAPDAADNREPDSRLTCRPSRRMAALSAVPVSRRNNLSIGFRPCSKPAAGIKFDHWSMIRKSGNRFSLDKREALARRSCSKQGDEITIHFNLMGSGSNPFQRERTMLRKMMLAALVVTFAGGAAFAQETCETKAVGKDGKPLAGAAKTSFMKKCEMGT